MTQLKTERKVVFYTCGKCKGSIRYLPSKGKPKVCPECGYGHGERGVNDVPSEVKLFFSKVGEESEAQKGITEQTTITSR